MYRLPATKRVLETTFKVKVITRIIICVVASIARGFNIIAGAKYPQVPIPDGVPNIAWHSVLNETEIPPTRVLVHIRKMTLIVNSTPILRLCAFDRTLDNS